MQGDEGKSLDVLVRKTEAEVQRDRKAIAHSREHIRSILEGLHRTKDILQRAQQQLRELSPAVERDGDKLTRTVQHGNFPAGSDRVIDATGAREQT